ncbi:cupin domain-containing protein [Chloroflexota bacterium]
MEVIRTSEVSKKPVTNPLFTGGTVTGQPLLPKGIRRHFNMSMINFGKGARNKLHSHTSDQVLIVTAGMGVIATGQDEVIIREGDNIYIPAGEKHWHGATKDSELSHISVVLTDSKTTQLED